MFLINKKTHFWLPGFWRIGGLWLMEPLRKQLKSDPEVLQLSLGDADPLSGATVTRKKQRLSTAMDLSDQLWQQPSSSTHVYLNAALGCALVAPAGRRQAVPARAASAFASPVHRACVAPVASSGPAPSPASACSHHALLRTHEHVRAHARAHRQARAHAHAHTPTSVASRPCL